MPPWMFSVFGDQMKGEIVMSEAAVGECLVHNVETVRAALEILAGDHAHHGEEFHSRVVALTSEVEKKMIKFAPPVLPGAELQDAFNWMDYLVWVADSSRDLSNTEPAAPTEQLDPPPVEYNPPMDPFSDSFMDW